MRSKHRLAREYSNSLYEETLCVKSVSSSYETFDWGIATNTARIRLWQAKPEKSEGKLSSWAYYFFGGDESGGRTRVALTKQTAAERPGLSPPVSSASSPVYPVFPSRRSLWLHCKSSRKEASVPLYLHLLATTPILFEELLFAGAWAGATCGGPTASFESGILDCCSFIACVGVTTAAPF